MRKMFSQKQINELIQSGALVEIEKYIKANQEAGENPSTLSTIKIGDTIYVIPQKTDSEIKALAKAEVEDAESGTIVDALGLDGNGGLVKGAVSGGTKLYKHSISYGWSSGSGSLDLISNKSSAYTLQTLRADVGNVVILTTGFYNTDSSYGTFIRSLAVKSDVLHINTVNVNQSGSVNHSSISESLITSFNDTVTPL